ncbi:alpha/beta family hydrolase [Thalassotalea sediminis]|uniref:alpha/beta family hydrolase n=1 Tax=Thalassotalea sediminis TaxID=1759089 RepID=UPI0025729A9D|nr:alpha/beta family hydrolase [Thalassotalea sediminis]
MSFSYIENLVDKPKAHFLFAHGAGADKSSGFMTNIASGLNERNFSVTRFNFNYMDKRQSDGKKYPPERMPKLLSCFSDVIVQHSFTAPLYLIGKSMGSRVAVTLTSKLADVPVLTKSVQGVVCLGYPFHPIGKPDNLRLEPIKKNDLPILIVQGERDKLGNKEEVLSYQLPANVKSVFMADGDHDLKPRVKSGFTHDQHLNDALSQIERFVLENE